MAVPLYIFDLDGTLADQTHRRHFLDKNDWESYFDSCPEDSPIQPVIDILYGLYWSGADIWVFSGRSDRVREQTLTWLDWHTCLSRNRFNDNQLVMRRAGDTRPDDVIKQEMLDNMLLCDRERLVAVFDDRDRVVAMWRRNGIQCLQVAPGDF